MASAMLDIAVPTMPARNLDVTAAFYGQIAFEQVFRHPDPEGYSILRRGSMELHFFLWPDLDPAKNYAGCYLRVADVEAFYEECARLRLPARGTPSLAGIEPKFYQMREFRLVDPDGNLLRIGEPMRRPGFPH